MMGHKTNSQLITRARYLLRAANIIRYENNHTVIDVTLLRDVQDCDLAKYRNVGKKTLETINEIRRSLDWVL